MEALEDDHAVGWFGHRFIYLFIIIILQELVLQEEGIERVDSTLGTLCQHLKILYMPNNLIARLGKTSFLTSITMCFYGWFEARDSCEMICESKIRARSHCPDKFWISYEYVNSCQSEDSFSSHNEHI
jgi:hypothetical protein